MIRKRKNLINSTFKGKKGVIELIFVLVVLLVFAITIFSGKLILNEINDDLQADDDMSVEAKQQLNDSNDNYTILFDNLFVFLFIGLAIGLIITSFLVDTHPVFFIISLILMGFVIFVGATMSNVYQEFVAEDDFSVYTTNYYKTNYIMENIVIFLLLIGFIMVIVLYGKFKDVI